MRKKFNINFSSLKFNGTNIEQVKDFINGEYTIQVSNREYPESAILRLKMKDTEINRHDTIMYVRPGENILKVNGKILHATFSDTGVNKFTTKFDKKKK